MSQNCIATDEHLPEELGCDEELRIWKVCYVYIRNENAKNATIFSSVCVLRSNENDDNSISCDVDHKYDDFKLMKY